MIEGGSMGNRILTIFFCIMWVNVSITSQDKLPLVLEENKRLPIQEETELLTTFPVEPVLIGNSIPSSFKNTQDNQIKDDTGSLFTFFEKLKRMSKPVRIVHIGDSHIRGHVLTQTIRYDFERDFGKEAVYPDTISYYTSGLLRETGKAGIVYHTIGINGATTVNFANDTQVQEIASLKPDLIIVSFGTNESHGRNYTSDSHILEMDYLIGMLKRENPKVAILLTTPPASYVRQRRKRVVNTRTALVAQTIVKYADTHGLASWDIYTIAGGKSQAALNWANNNYMLRDKVHYNHAGYQLLGNLLYEAIIKAYNNYVAD